MKVGIGVARDLNAARLAGEASDTAMGEAGAVRAGLAIVFATSHSAVEYCEILKTVRRVTGAVHIVGSSASGIISMQGEHEEGPSCAVMVLDGEGKDSLLGTHFFRQGRRFGLAKPPGLGQGGSLVVFSDPATFDQRLLNEIAMTGGTTVFGAGASGFVQEIVGAPVFYENESFRDSMVACRFSNDLQLNLCVAYGCRALSAPFIVTKVRQNVILELAGKPAAKMLEEKLTQAIRQKGAVAGWNKPLPLLAGIMRSAPLLSLVPKPWEFYVKPILAVDPRSGGILIDEELRIGSQITFVLREKEWAHAEIKGSLEEFGRRLRGKRPLFGFYFNCAGRGHDLFGEENHDLNIIRSQLGEFPLMGMFSAFELATQDRDLAAHGFAGVLGVFT
ncbi:MAG: FIST C-terminal domain-containing protein [Elusimicrobia bacterium]|nr:FIST C-terminal domain-containing protein [Elusimicrobiota bacterium]